jgi:hypothetical protein
MHYLATTPVILENSELAQHLGTMHKTPYPEGIRQTMAWFQAWPSTD